MINSDKWISSLPKINLKSTEEKNQLDHDKWINTIPKKNTNYSAKKYSIIAILFVCGLLSVSVVKNETRNLQKEINNLEASINSIKFNLDQATLDNEVITSPENISKIAKEHLGTELVAYKRSQIKNLSDDIENLPKVSKIKKEESNKIKNLKDNIKKKVANKVTKKKAEIKKLQKLYEDPEVIPGEIRIQFAKQVKEKKKELKNIYSSPSEIFTLERVSRWTVVQVVKLFLGMPIVPGR